MKKILLLGALALALAAPVAAEEVHFARGSSSAHLRRGIARGETHRLTLKAGRGQEMTVSVTSPEYNAVFGVFKDGRPIGHSHNEHGAENWTGRLPSNGTYVIELGTTRGGAEATIDIIIR